MTAINPHEKHWEGYVEGYLNNEWQHYISNNNKIDVTFAASHLLGQVLDKAKQPNVEGELIVFMKDLADQRVYRVVMQQERWLVDPLSQQWTMSRQCVGFSEVEQK